ncbi:glycosyltransferase [Lewinella sp. W8]|uniref:glycosyltransferase n=1 Tax=Lewinella sp. W8 TaxID=2528208 RepID=UPI00106772B1|nr:glycosyltransferase [Lewinella sp. W8]MTB52690.1 glycosyltransferase [Lewinella sp. W8]
MRFHIIIPVINEADNLRQLLPLLERELSENGQITVADGGSSDGTAEVLARHPKVRHLTCVNCGRAFQMNEAARWEIDQFEVLHFLHADTRPPGGFLLDIEESVRMGYPAGCFRFKFDSAHPLLAINAFFTRFRGLACRGGDQSLYLTRTAFGQLDGFRPMKIMEDYDIIQRIWASEIPFRVIPRSVTVSARKYRANNYFRVQIANLMVFRMYRKGASEEAMISRYRSLLQEW